MEIIQKLSFLKQYLKFILTLICILGTLGLAYFKNSDVTVLLPTLLGLYLGTRTSEKVSAHWSASKDPSCNTAQVIESLNDK